MTIFVISRKGRSMKATSISFNDYAVSDTDMARIKSSIENMDTLFSAVKSIAGVGFLKMQGYSISVLDVNSYPLMTIYVNERYRDSVIYRFS